MVVKRVWDESTMETDSATAATEAAVARVSVVLELFCC